MPSIPTTSSRHQESLGARIARRAAQERLAPPVPVDRPKAVRRGEHEYVRERGKALAILADQTDRHAQVAKEQGQAAAAVIGFAILRAEQPTVSQPNRIDVRVVHGGGGSAGLEWTPTARATEPIERPTKKRGRPGRRGKLVAALARSRKF